jgi:hypothetical protein
MNLKVFTESHIEENGREIKMVIIEIDDRPFLLMTVGVDKGGATIACAGNARGTTAFYEEGKLHIEQPFRATVKIPSSAN